MYGEHIWRAGVGIEGPRWVALGTVAVAAAACGSTQAKSARQIQTKNAVLTAYSHSITTGSAKVSFTETVNGNSNGSPQHVTVNGQGVTELRSPKGDLTITLPSLGSSLEVRMLDNYLYVKLPSSLQSEAAAIGNKSWIAVNLNALTEKQFGESLAQLSSSSESPTQALSYLQSVSATGLVKEGTGKIDGVPSTEYQAVISLKKAASELSGPAARVIRAAERLTGSTTLPVKVWVDGDNLVRRISYHLAVGNASSAVSSIDTAVTLSDYGTPVNVTAPPASDTFDLTSQALAALSSGLSGSSGAGAGLSGNASTANGTSGGTAASSGTP